MPVNRDSKANWKLDKFMNISHELKSNCSRYKYCVSCEHCKAKGG